MKMIVKVTAASFAFALTLLTVLYWFLFDLCAFFLTIILVIVAVFWDWPLFHAHSIGRLMFLFLAFLLSPYGLQVMADFLIRVLDGGKSTLFRFLIS